MKRAILLLFITMAAPVSAGERSERVPFVGCPADGQQGPQQPPNAHRGPRLPAKQASLALYGSSESILIVRPTKHKAAEFFTGHRLSIHGPAVQVDLSYGGTSGRYAVANAVARYFPTERDFVREVVEMDRQSGALSIEPLPSKPYPTDVITDRTNKSIRFMTPIHRQGEGTHSWLAPDNDPIEGIRALLKGSDGPDLYGVDVRLPPKLRDLTQVILSSAKGSD